MELDKISYGESKRFEGLSQSPEKIPHSGQGEGELARGWETIAGEIERRDKVLGEELVAPQVPLSMGFPRQEYWSRLSFPSPRDLSDPGIEPESPALVGRLFTTVPSRKLSSRSPSDKPRFVFWDSFQMSLLPGSLLWMAQFGLASSSLFFLPAIFFAVMEVCIWWGKFRLRK